MGGGAGGAEKLEFVARDMGWTQRDPIFGPSQPRPEGKYVVPKWDSMPIYEQDVIAAYIRDFQPSFLYDERIKFATKEK